MKKEKKKEEIERCKITFFFKQFQMNLPRREFFFFFWVYTIHQLLSNNQQGETDKDNNKQGMQLCTSPLNTRREWSSWAAEEASVRCTKPTKRRKTCFASISLSSSPLLLCRYVFFLVLHLFPLSPRTYTLTTFFETWTSSSSVKTEVASEAAASLTTAKYLIIITQPIIMSDVTFMKTTKPHGRMFFFLWR